MAAEKQFSHITVNAAEDDDVVIQAGAPVEPAATEPTYEPGPARPEQDFEYVEEDGQAESAPVPVAGEEPEELLAEGGDRAAAETAAAPSGEQAWREQTLEDLEAGPMSGMQKIVLGAAAAFVVVALVWYFCFMR